MYSPNLSKPNLATIVNQELLKTGRAIGDFFVTGGHAFYTLAITPYIIPTAIRQNREGIIDVTLIGAGIYCRSSVRNEERSPNNAEILGGSVGTVVGAVTTIAGVLVYPIFLATPEYPEVGAIPLVTNLMSEMYEISKHIYQRHNNNQAS